MEQKIAVAGVLDRSISNRKIKDELYEPCIVGNWFDKPMEQIIST